VPRHERTTGGSAFYRLYQTADGRHIALGGQEMKFVRNLLAALGRPELGELCARGPGPHQKPVADFLAATFRTKPRDEWVAWLSQLDVCFAPVNSLPEALADPGVAARGLLMTDASGRRHLAPPIRFREEPARPSLREPRLGEHDELKKPRPG
jgi:crotonobetainyl-CoA:carnitine CoA-transferase CaiB-like acyl-CoA transferase